MKNMNNKLFEDYDAFVNKFKPKKTTDDCYTPKEVYNVVLNFVNSFVDLSKFDIVRPFYPGGDYESEHYDNNCIVIDNPPFSIISKIAKFYEERGIKYFLFAPHLTLFSIRSASTYIVACAKIMYHNGAIVNTDFISNLFGKTRIMTASSLNEALTECQNKTKIQLPKYQYPTNVLTVSKLERLVKKHIDISINEDQVHAITKLQSQAKVGKTVYGGGFLISDEAAKELAAKELAAKDNIIQWQLSLQELAVIDILNKKN